MGSRKAITSAPPLASVTRSGKGEAPPVLRGAMSPAHAAEYLDISPRQMARYLACGAIASIKLGKLRRILRAELDRYLETLAAESEAS